MTTENLGDLVRNYRKEHSLTQEELAEKVDCSISTIWRVEHTDYIPGKKYLKKILECIHEDLYSFNPKYPTKKQYKRASEVLLCGLERREWSLVEENMKLYGQRDFSDPSMSQFFETVHLIWNIMCRQQFGSNSIWTEKSIVYLKNRITEQLERTIPGFSPNMRYIRDISKTELLLLNAYAMTCYRIGEKKYALNIMNMLIQYLSDAIIFDRNSYKDLGAVCNNKAVLMLRQGAIKESFPLLKTSWSYTMIQGSIYTAVTIMKNLYINCKRLGDEDGAKANLSAFNSMVSLMPCDKSGVFLAEPEEEMSLMVF